MDVYNKLRLIDDCLPHVPTIDAAMPRLLDLLDKHGLGDKLGISLVHRHWDLLSDNEKVVELENDTYSISSVFVDGEPDPEMLGEWKLSLPEGSEIVPAKFFINDLQLIPFEYDCVDSSSSVAYRERTRALTGEFIEEFAKLAASSGVQGMVGPAVLPSDGIRNGWEVSDLDKRLNIVTFGEYTESADHEPITTLWLVKGSGQPIGRWCQYGRHCRRCTIYRREHTRKRSAGT
jgi:hypothetical protein